MSSIRREGESPSPTRISRRTLFEYVAVMGGLLTTAAASADGVVADISVTRKLADRKKPRLVDENLIQSIRAGVNRLAQLTDQSTAQEQAVETGKVFADAAETYNEEREQVKSELWAESNQTQIIGDVTRGSLRHWAFWGGVAATAIGTISHNRYVEKTIAKARNAIRKN